MSSKRDTGYNFTPAAYQSHRSDLNYKSKYHKFPAKNKYLQNDKRIELQAMKLLSQTDEVEVDNIKVEVNNGVVSILGHVATTQKKKLIEKVLYQLDQFKSLQNFLTVLEPH